MSYLRFRNWSRYQNADLAKKSPHGLAWIKLWTRHDAELAALSVPTRLLFYELLKLAGLERNAIERDLNRISSLTGIPLKQVVKGVDELLQGAWLSETKTNRGSRVVSRVTLDQKEKREREESPRAFVDQEQEQMAEVRDLVERSLRSVG